jgi:hypothetical protein
MASLHTATPSSKPEALAMPPKTEVFLLFLTPAARCDRSLESPQFGGHGPFQTLQDGGLVFVHGLMRERSVLIAEAQR